jgi:hypothetical protein
MFYDFVKTKLEAGSIVVDPPSRDTDGRVNIKARGITAIAVLFLSQEEKQRIETLAKHIAMRRCRVRYGNLEC